MHESSLLAECMFAEMESTESLEVPSFLGFRDDVVLLPCFGPDLGFSAIFALRAASLSLNLKFPPAVS